MISIWKTCGSLIAKLDLHHFYSHPQQDSIMGWMKNLRRRLQGKKMLPITNSVSCDTATGRKDDRKTFSHDGGCQIAAKCLPAVMLISMILISQLADEFLLRQLLMPCTNSFVLLSPFRITQIADTYVFGGERAGCFAIKLLAYISS